MSWESIRQIIELDTSSTYFHSTSEEVTKVR
jgi:hypothetical protein